MQEKDKDKVNDFLDKVDALLLELDKFKDDKDKIFEKPSKKPKK